SPSQKFAPKSTVSERTCEKRCRSQSSVLPALRDASDSNCSIFQDLPCVASKLLGRGGAANIVALSVISDRLPEAAPGIAARGAEDRSRYQLPSFASIPKPAL